MKRFPVLFAVALLAAITACRPRTESFGGPIRNSALGVSFAQLPSGFLIERNEGNELVLRHGEALLSVEVGDEVRGVNLVEEVRKQPTDFEALPGGRYLGNTELMTPIGPAYSARGRFREGEKEIEEARLLAVHPSGSRLLTLRYRYPVKGDSKERVGQLLEAMAMVEGVTVPAEEPADVQEAAAPSNAG